MNIKALNLLESIFITASYPAGNPEECRASIGSFNPQKCAMKIGFFLAFESEPSRRRFQRQEKVIAK
jgi:hypothetical protein